MLRALEFAARLGFSLGERVREGISLRAPLIAEAAPARIREELMELFRHRVGGTVLRNAQAMGLLPHLLAGFEGDDGTFDLLERIDVRTAGGAPVEEHLVLAALFLSRFRRACPPESESTVNDALRIANLVLAPHCGYFRLSHGTRHLARELLVGFVRLVRGLGRRGERRFLKHPMTPQVLEFYGLWAEASGEDMTLVEDWQKALDRSREGETKPAAEQPSRPRRRSRRRRPRRPKPPAS